MAKMFSETYLKKMYDKGARAKNNNSELIDALRAFDIEMEGADWEQHAMFRAGYNGTPFEVKEYDRFGDINYDDHGWPERSRNHATGEPEIAISVADENWMKTFNALWMGAHNRKMIKIQGIAVGTGSDGEIVIVPCGM